MDTRLLGTLWVLLLAGCTFHEEAESPREPRPETRPTPEPVPRDACLGCGMGFVPEVGKAFLDVYSAQKA
jgi:hypothetical protein